MAVATLDQRRKLARWAPVVREHATDCRVAYVGLESMLWHEATSPHLGALNGLKPR